MHRPHRQSRRRGIAGPDRVLGAIGLFMDLCRLGM